MTLKSTLNKYLGKTINNYKVLSFDKLTHDKNNPRYARSWFKCECLKCGSITSVRSDRLSASNSVVCSVCFPANCSKIMRKKYEGKASKKARGVINHIRSKNNKKYHVELDFDEHECEKMLKQPCHYCGRTPTGFDRIDSRYGYYKANIVPCCRACNIFKMDYTYDDFKENVIRIYNNWIVKGSTTIPQGSTSQVNGDGKGEHLEKGDDIV